MPRAGGGWSTRRRKARRRNISSSTTGRPSPGGWSSPSSTPTSGWSTRASKWSSSGRSVSGHGVALRRGRRVPLALVALPVCTHAGVRAGNIPTPYGMEIPTRLRWLSSSLLCGEFPCNYSALRSSWATPVCSPGELQSFSRSLFSCPILWLLLGHRFQL